MAKNPFNEYDDSIGDIPELINTDVNIKPEYYIHKALLKAQDCLLKDDVKAGFMQYRVMVEYIEILCKSANLFPENYEERLDEFKKTKEYIKENDNMIKAVKLANQKLNILMEEVFSTKTATDALKV